MLPAALKFGEARVGASARTSRQPSDARWSGYLRSPSARRPSPLLPRSVAHSGGRTCQSPRWPFHSPGRRCDAGSWTPPERYRQPRSGSGSESRLESESMAASPVGSPPVGFPPVEARPGRVQLSAGWLSAGWLSSRASYRPARLSHRDGRSPWFQSGDVHFQPRPRPSVSPANRPASRSGHTRYQSLGSRTCSAGSGRWCPCFFA